MEYRCIKCNIFYHQYQLQKLKCTKHYICNSCSSFHQTNFCTYCKVGEDRVVQSNNYLRNYPIQGIMVHYHQVYNPEGQSQFRAKINCYGRTPGWILIGFLALVFFFSGLAMAINTAERGTGVIMTIVGFIGLIIAIYFIFSKIPKVQKQCKSSIYANQDRFIIVKQQKRIISSVGTENN